MDIFFYYRWWLITKLWYYWDKLSNDIKKEFDSESVYDKKDLKIKIKSNGDEVTEFNDKKFLRWILIILV